MKENVVAKIRTLEELQSFREQLSEDIEKADRLIKKHHRLEKANAQLKSADISIKIDTNLFGKFSMKIDDLKSVLDNLKNIIRISKSLSKEELQPYYTDCLKIQDRLKQQLLLLETKNSLLKLENLLKIESTKEATFKSIQNAYNKATSEGDFVSQVKKTLSIEDNSNDKILQAGYNAIKSTCGKQFDLDKILVLEKSDDTHNAIKALFVCIYNYIMNLLGKENIRSAQQDKKDVRSFSELINTRIKNQLEIQ